MTSARTAIPALLPIEGSVTACDERSVSGSRNRIEMVSKPGIPVTSRGKDAMLTQLDMAGQIPCAVRAGHFVQNLLEFSVTGR